MDILAPEPAAWGVILDDRSPAGAWQIWFGQAQNGDCTRDSVSIQLYGDSVDWGYWKPVSPRFYTDFRCRKFEFCDLYIITK